MFKGTIYLIKFCWQHDKRYIIYLAAIQILSVLTSFLSLIIPKYIIDWIIEPKEIQDILWLITTFLVINLIMSFSLNLLQQQIFSKKIKLFNIFQIEINTKMILADYEELESKEFLNLKEKAYKFMYSDGQGFGQSVETFFSTIGNFLYLLTLIGLVAQLGISIFLLIASITSFILIFEVRAKRKNTYIQLEKVNFERRGMYYSQIMSDYSFGKDIRIDNLGKWLMGKFKYQLDVNEKFYKEMGKNITFSSNLTACMQFLQQIILYIILINRISKKILSIGDFSMYLNAVSNFSSTIKSIMSNIIDLQQYNIYFSEFIKFSELKQEMRIGKIPFKKDESTLVVEFQNVSFKYKNQKEYALKNISFITKNITKIGLVGANGSGKSTLIKLLTKLYMPSEGKILINGLDIQEISYETYSKLFSVVYQDFKLFSFSVKDNICTNHKYIKENFDNAISATSVNDLIEELCEKEETYIYKDFSNKSFSPSGGEAQKIAFSRALYKNSDILILDEPTAAQDPISEKNILSQIEQLSNSKMVIHISHKMLNLKACDVILVLEKGILIEYGSPEELKNSPKSLYNEYLNIQNS
ncbi:ABC transporter ATP-binding protein [Candidatus Enterococcus clewellii]|uniref:ABC transporter domain-containing protein n=1 Tax=Candidatus Enterococcus clewellii TaxID=1834193 RepID=A0AAQ3VWN5_9ENTE